MSNTQSPSMNIYLHIPANVAVYPYKHRIKLTFVIISAKTKNSTKYSSFRFPNGKLYYHVIFNFQSTCCHILLKCVNVPLFKILQVINHFKILKTDGNMNPQKFTNNHLYSLKLHQTPIKLLKVSASVHLVNIYI